MHWVLLRIMWENCFREDQIKLIEDKRSAYTVGKSIGEKQNRGLRFVF